MEAVLILVLLTGFIAVLGATVLLGSHLTRPASFASSPIQAHAIPSRGRTVFFSKAERAFYKALRTVVPDHMIFVKVRLADLVSLKPRTSFWEHFSALNRKRIDFVVCDPTLSPVLAIELDESGQRAVSSPPGDLVNSVLASASLPIVHVAQKRSYLFTELRRLLSPYLIMARPLI
jgi:hypothetical protein